jgi:hypothetical protein
MDRKMHREIHMVNLIFQPWKWGKLKQVFIHA